MNVLKMLAYIKMTLIPVNALRVFIAICRNPNVICQKKWSNYIYLPFVLNSCKVILVDIKINAKVNT